MNKYRTRKIALLYAILFFSFLFFFFNIISIAFDDDNKINTTKSVYTKSLRGEIYSRDGKLLVYSKDLYQISMNNLNLNPEKEDAFYDLYSIYTGENIKDIKNRLHSRRGNVVLSSNTSLETAKNLRKLGLYLNRLGVLIPYERLNGKVFNYGLNVIKSGESRSYLFDDTFEPILGYVNKKENGNIITIEGIKGVEKSEDSLLSVDINNISGLRDVNSYLIRNKESMLNFNDFRYSVVLNMPYKLQKGVENIIDTMNKNFESKEIIVAIMDAETGEILSMASTNRFNPNKIRESDYPNLNASFVESTFEPGSVIKPLVFSLLIKDNLINLNDLIYLEKGRYKIGNDVITDTHPMGDAKVRDVIIESSNIGMSKLSQRLNPLRFREGMSSFGLSNRTGIELPREARGILPSVNTLRREIYRASSSYGYGLETTFIQLLAAYNVFSNDGVWITPTLINHIVVNGKKRKKVENIVRKRVLEESVVNSMRGLLKDVIKEGTGRGVKIDGLSMGGKTGTAHIAQKGEYVNKYMASFFGFVEDNYDHRYTIGVTVFDPKSDTHFASKTAGPVFRELANELIKDGYLKLDEKDIIRDKEERKEAKKRAREKYLKKLRRLKHKKKA